MNYAMAVLMRKRHSLQEAENYAKRAISTGVRKAPLALANILYDQAQEPTANVQIAAVSQKLNQALDALSDFKPEYGNDKEVADAIASKIYRTLGNSSFR